ncbi:MAG: L,D-transpeptidase family protein [Deltaproteobacteria bacterium]|nr:L,D-transpeptidase family protein [Deltaproteobacteria bacterium]
MSSRFRFTLLVLATLALAPRADARAAWDDVVFTRTDGLSGAGQSLVAWLARARLHGLELAPDPIVARWLDPAARAAEPDPNHTQRAVERALVAGLARLVAELPPRPRTTPVLEHPEHRYYLSPDVTWRDAPRPEASPEALTAALDAARAGRLDEHLHALAPRHPQYARLVAAGERYAELCAAGGWPILERPKFEKAAQKPEVARALQERLALEGFYEGSPSGVWDEPTLAALAAFRDARQVKDRGVADRLLYDALNVPCEERLKTLALNARRWRVSAWHELPTWVEVNLAGQELRFYRDGALVRHVRTVVGGNDSYLNKALGRRVYPNASPILTDHIERIVINPQWAVPARIAINEIDKAIAKDPTYLEKHRFVKLTTKTGGYQYIQQPGAGNALGQIKILFPNTEDVYLHDTSKRAAFRHAVRAMSHGCVRVQDALELGVELLATDAAASGQVFDEAAVRRQVHGGSRTYDLAHGVAVFFEYYTASVDESGRVRFHPDIYAYDAETLAAEQVATP